MKKDKTARQIIYEDIFTLSAQNRRYHIFLVSVMNKQMLFTARTIKKFPRFHEAWKYFARVFRVSHGRLFTASVHKWFAKGYVIMASICSMSTHHPTNVWCHHICCQCTVNSLDNEGDVKSIHPLLPYPIKAHQSSVVIAVPDGSGVAKGVGWCRPGKFHPLSCLPGQSSDGGLQGGWGQAGETPLTSDLLDRRIREI